MRALTAFAGDPGKFREWNDCMLNALAQGNDAIFQGLRLLSTELEVMGGAVPEPSEEDKFRLLSGKGGRE